MIVCKTIIYPMAINRMTKGQILNLFKIRWVQSGGIAPLIRNQIAIKTNILYSLTLLVGIQFAISVCDF